MTRPTFDEFTPPSEVMLAAFGQCFVPLDGASVIARWGAQQAAEQLAGQWPEPITDRPPTEADGDGKDRIQFIFQGGWSQCLVKNWEGEPWRHTPAWKPRPKPAYSRDEAIKQLFECALNEEPPGDALVNCVVTYLKAQP